jgi:hypothetical protein
MDRYRKIKCVQGLIISLDEQIYRADQNKASDEHHDMIINKYWDAMREQLDEPEKKKEDIAEPRYDYVIKVNCVAHAYFEEKISYDQIVFLSNFSQSKNKLYTITYSHGHPSKSEGSLTPNESVKVQNHMIFNIADTSGA